MNWEALGHVPDFSIALVGPHESPIDVSDLLGGNGKTVSEPRGRYEGYDDVGIANIINAGNYSLRFRIGLGDSANFIEGSLGLFNLTGPMHS